MNLPSYTFPIFLSVILLLAFLAFFPNSTTILTLLFILPALVLYQAYVILKDGANENQE